MAGVDACDKNRVGCECFGFFFLECFNIFFVLIFATEFENL